MKIKKYITNETMLALMKEITHLERKKGNVLYYEGDAPKNFYIIIDGKVEVL